MVLAPDDEDEELLEEAPDELVVPVMSPASGDAAEDEVVTSTELSGVGSIQIKPRVWLLS